MARRPGARRIDPRVVRLPGFEVEPSPAQDEPSADRRPAETVREPDTAGPQTQVPTPRRHDPPPGPTLEERQKRWLKERDRFVARRSS